MKWKDKLIKDLARKLTDFEPFAYDLLSLIKSEKISLHLAIFNEPFLSLVFDGKKTMESRFSINYVAPYRKVSSGDLVLLKKPGEDVCGFFVVGKVYYFSNLSAEKISQIENDFGKELCWNIDPDFLSNKASAKYLSLFEITMTNCISPIQISKSDRTAWSVIKLGLQNTLFSKMKTLENSIVIGISGRISSGKSTIAKRIHKHLNASIMSFGKFLMDYSIERELPITRDDLQSLGEHFVKADSTRFLQDVLDSQDFIPPIVIIEGIRHKSIYNEIKRRSTQTLFIFIDVPMNLRYQWYNERIKDCDKKVSLEKFQNIDSHPVEVEINELKNFETFLKK